MSWALRLAMLLSWTLGGTAALAIDVVSMYRGSCQVDVGVVLRVDGKTVTYLSLGGVVKRIPRYEIVGVASYPLPGLPVEEVTIPTELEVPYFEFTTMRDGKLTPITRGWPIDYNAEHLQVLTLNGTDHLVHRNDIWGVHRFKPESHFRMAEATMSGQAYLLRHPLAFEKCSEVITVGKGTPVSIIPASTYDNPIAIKRYHDHLRDGYTKIEDYEDRQRFYAVPQRYGNKTRLGTWTMLGSRYANVGSRQVNFLPLVESELSEGPFGFQRLVRSGVAPLIWAMHEEPIVQAYYGLKADYIHLELFFDPTGPLIGEQYKYNKSQLNLVDDRWIERGGFDFGFDFGFFTFGLIYTEGNWALRLHDWFEASDFGLTRYGVVAAYNYWRLGAYVGGNSVPIDDDLQARLNFAKLFAEGRWGAWHVTPQLIRRQLKTEAGSKRSEQFESNVVTAATEVEWDINYRWTTHALVSLERQEARGRAANGVQQRTQKIWPKLALGATIAF